MRISPVKIIADAMLEKKAHDVLSLDLRSIGTAICDHFVICNADSTTAVAAIADNVIVRMEEKAGKKVIRMQGLENGFWIILDYGEVVVHIFLTEHRQFYRLEDLWADAKIRRFKDETEIGGSHEGETVRVKPKAVSKLRSAVRKNSKKSLNGSNK